MRHEQPNYLLFAFIDMRIFKNLLIIFFIIISANSIAQDTIHWQSNYKLMWSDFTGQPDMTSEYKAITAADIKFILSYNNSSFDVKVDCIFDKKKSWTSRIDSIGLVHEQGHFDIAELFARKLRKAFREYVFNPKTIESDFNKIFDSIKKERKAFNNLYDKETNFSRNKIKQIYWNKKIATELKKLEVFSK